MNRLYLNTSTSPPKETSKNNYAYKQQKLPLPYLKNVANGHKNANRTNKISHICPPTITQQN